MPTLRNFTKRFIVFSNFFICLLFLLACCNPFLHPARWWFISLLGIVFPFLLLGVFCFFIFWLFFSSRKWALISLLTLLIGWKDIHALLGFHIGAAFKNEKAAGSIRILTWNVHEWDEFSSPKSNLDHWEKMTEFLKEQNADIMCFQEFFECHNARILPDNIEYICKELNYPYYYFSQDYHHYSWVYETGVIIFSRFPIKDTLQVKFRKESNIRATESLIAADLDINGKPLRIFTTHLQSVLFHNRDYHNIDIIRNADDSMLMASKSIIKKLRKAYGFRGEQADLVRSAIDSCQVPHIICGDFNDLPGSYTYSTIRGNMQDAFTSKGFGIGRTYVNLSPTLRIDYILCSPETQVLQCLNFKPPYSDHHPVIADIRLPDGGI